MDAHPHPHPPGHNHNHGHDHDGPPHVPGHPHPETHNAGAGAGPVMIDVGGGAGALILHTDPAMAGSEIEISPAGQDTHRTHVAVLARPLGPATIHAAVYPTLAAGTWHLWHPHTSHHTLTVTIHDGQVTEARWPT